MNKARRKEVAAVVALINEAGEKLQRVRDDEQLILDRFPILFRESDAGLRSQETIDQLDELVVDLETIEESLAAYGGEDDEE